ncbi:Serine/threonine protein kinase PRP4 [Mycena kentingensis (nom. inval.)]|nr:Serine/threonine protein kinase PRP4 [Mycena kentingensis (nom. inval.)]
MYRCVDEYYHNLSHLAASCASDDPVAAAFSQVNVENVLAAEPQDRGREGITDSCRFPSTTAMSAKRLSLVVGHFKAFLRHKDGEDNKAQKAHKHDWTTTPLPPFDALPAFKNFPGCAWGVWGAEDELGTVNLLTEAVVKLAASEEIRLGRSVGLNWPLNFPEKPMFARKAPEINMTVREPREIGVRDDEIHINTQSGTQWDGLRHVPIIEHGVFYNNTPVDSLARGIIPLPDPGKVDPAHAKLGIQNWAMHGICGRGVLLDLVTYQTSLSAGKTLPYDPWSTHAISVAQLEACAAAQGVKFRRGDILLLRVGFIKRYNEATLAEGRALCGQCGDRAVAGYQAVLWNNHFAAVASDQPALERWPPPGELLHQTILGLWGMPIGEFFDLEKLAEICAETGRYTFFFSSWPLNMRPNQIGHHSHTAPLPSYDELPAFKNFPGCAWGVWGTDDQLGTINLLTDAVVQRSAAEQIRTGKTVSLNWPLNFPSKPMFGRLPPTINYIQKQKEGRNYSRDDEIHINTQSGSQWDGLRHFPILEHKIFYNNTPAVDLRASASRIGRTTNAPDGDGVLPYDPWTTHAITVAELEACAQAQQVEFRRGDFLILRVGFTRRYYAATQEERDGLRGKPETFPGIEQSEDMKRFLWNNHFAAIASDMPSMEWKRGQLYRDLQRLSDLCPSSLPPFMSVEDLTHLVEAKLRIVDTPPVRLDSGDLAVDSGASGPDRKTHREEALYETQSRPSTPHSRESADQDALGAGSSKRQIEDPPHLAEAATIPHLSFSPCAHNAAVFQRLISDLENIYFVGESTSRAMAIALAVLRRTWQGIWASDLDKRWLVPIEPETLVAVESDTLLQKVLWNGIEERVKRNDVTSRWRGCAGQRVPVNDLIHELKEATMELEEMARKDVVSRLGMTKVDAQLLGTPGQPPLPTKRNIWFQCPWGWWNEIPGLIQNFITSAAKVQTAGDAIFIGIITDPGAFCHYDWEDALSTAKRAGYGHTELGGCFTARAMDAGYVHRNWKDDEGYHRGHWNEHELHMFVKK